MSEITDLTKLIDLNLLEALYDEWMDAEYFNVSLSGTSITVTDKRGNTNTTDLAAAAKQAKSEWDNTYKPQMDADHTRAEGDHTTAVSDHSTATSDHSTAVQDNTTATTDHSTATSDHSTAVSDHTRAESDHTRADGDHTTATTDHSTATTDHTRAENDHTRAESDHSTASSDHTQATTDHTASVTATDEASNVNAQINGLTVTITDRNGASVSVDIGFEMFKTYTSVAAMNADAANVPQGKFVIIATEDATSTDNARLYCKNSQGGFTFLSDLDQASSAAWADWLDNMKPLIESDHSRAGIDHTTASADHTTAVSDHTTADSDHTTAQADHSTAQADHDVAETDHGVAATDHTTATNDHTQAVSDHTTASSDHTRAESDHSTASTDHTTASSDHTTALSDHGIATSDHTQAGNDHTRAENDHDAAVLATQYAQTQGDRAKDYNDNPWSIGNDGYIYVWNETSQQMVRTNKVIIDFDDLTTEQKQSMAQAFYDTLVIASTQTCEDIVDELT